MKQTISDAAARTLQKEEQATFSVPGTDNLVRLIITQLTKLITGPIRSRTDLIQQSISDTTEPKLGLFEREGSCDFLFQPDLLRKTLEHSSYSKNPEYSQLLRDCEIQFKKLSIVADQILDALDRCFGFDLYKKMESLPERKRKLMRIVLYEPKKTISVLEHLDCSGLTFQVASSHPGLNFNGNGQSFHAQPDEITVFAGLQGEIATDKSLRGNFQGALNENWDSDSVLKASFHGVEQKNAISEGRWAVSFYVNFDVDLTTSQLSEIEKRKTEQWNSGGFAKKIAVL